MLFLVQAIKKPFVTCLALMFGPLAQDYSPESRAPIRPVWSRDGQMRDGREERVDRRMAAENEPGRVADLYRQVNTRAAKPRTATAIRKSCNI